MDDSGRMFKVDIHTHILPPQIPNFKKQFGYGGFLEYKPCAGCTDIDLYFDNGQFFRRVQQNAVNPSVRLKECADHGIGLQVLSTVPVMFSYSAKPQDGLFVSQFLNDHLAQVVRDHPKKFLGLATVPLQDPLLACRELRRAIKELNLSGVQIGSHVEDMNLSDPRLFPFYQECQDLGACLFVHPWDMMGKEKMPKYWLPWLVGMPAETSLAICSMIFGGVFEKFPRLRVAFAHGGGSFPMTWARIQHGFDSRPDLCAIDNPHPPKKYLGHFYVDSLVHNSAALKYIVDLIGHKKICIGSDYPFPLGENIPGKIIDERHFSETEKEWMSHLAAFEWLGVSKDGFEIKK